MLQYFVTDGRADEWTIGRLDGGTDGRADGRADGRGDRRAGWFTDVRTTACPTLLTLSPGWFESTQTGHCLTDYYANDDKYPTTPTPAQPSANESKMKYDASIHCNDNNASTRFCKTTAA